MTYTWKVIYNVRESTSHLELTIALNKSINDLKPFSDERCDVLIYKLNKLRLLVLGEIS
jgi:hypothetical protein